MALKSTVIIVTAACIGYIFAAKLPDTISKCRISDPELGECIRINTDAAIKVFRNGAPQLGIPPLDPLSIPRLVIGQGTGTMNVVQNFSNAELYGMTNSLTTKHTPDLENGRFYSESITYKLELLADYHMDGRILVLPIRGQGRCNITIINARLTHHMNGERYQKKGKTYFRVNEYAVTIEPDRMYYNLENLFDGDKRLGDEINKVMNENWKEVYADVKIGYEKSFGLIFLSLANSLFSRVAWDDLFLK